MRVRVMATTLYTDIQSPTTSPCKTIQRCRPSASYLSWPQPALQLTCLWTFPKALRVRRDTPGYAPPAPAYHPEPSYGHAKGRVGPVYTFVKTDPKANFKWGVRHRAGAQYGRR